MHNNHIYLSRPTFRSSLVTMRKFVQLKMRYYWFTSHFASLHSYTLTQTSTQ